MDAVELDPATAADEAELVRLARAFHAEDGHPLTESGVAALGLVARGHPLAKAWLVREAGRSVGYALLCLGFGIEYGGADAFVDDLYLVPEARGRGIGGRVLDRLEEEGRALGLSALFLVVDPDNAPAVRLYRGRGFATTPWLTMAKQLRADGDKIQTQDAPIQ
ncbi:MAG: GNAT family N-acetyltransferase [Geminicoccaceae bacterium]